MTDHRQSPTADDGELLSAYLASELDEDAADELERRLATEPRLAAQLDALADALVVLGNADAVEEPEGFAQRLEDRLSAAAAPADLAAHRRRRALSQQWLRIGSVAAVIALGAVMAGTMLRGGGGTVAMDTALEESGGAEDAGTVEAPAALSDGDSRPSAPVILDTNAEVAGEEALRERYQDVPEAQGLLGVPRDEAEELALAFTSAVGGRGAAAQPLESAPQAAGSAESGSTGGAGSGAQAPEPEPDAETEAAASAEDGAADMQQFSAKQRRQAIDAAAGDPCLADIIEDAVAPIVPVRVETIRYDGQPAVAYVVVTSRPDSQELDRLELWVFGQQDCSVLVWHQY